MYVQVFCKSFYVIWHHIKMFQEINGYSGLATRDGREYNRVKSNNKKRGPDVGVSLFIDYSD